MSTSPIALEQLLPLIPELDELEEFRFALLSEGMRDPEKAWEKSSEYSTVDKRIVRRERARAALDRAEESARTRLHELFDTCRSVLTSYWADDVAGAVLALARLAEVEESRSRHHAARKVLETALILSLPLPEKRGQILALRLLGRVLSRQGELPEAAIHYHRSAMLARDTGDVLSEAIADTGLGNVRLYQGRWSEAEALYQAAMQRLSETGLPDCELQRAQLHNNISFAAIRLGRLEDARRWLDRALQLLDGLDSPTDVAICHHNYGILHVKEERHTEARVCFEQALGQPVAPSVRAAIATDLALSYLTQGQMWKAKEIGRLAEEYAIAAQSPYVLGSLYRGLGVIAGEEGEDGAIAYFEKALEIARSREYLLLEGETLVEYGKLRHRMGQMDESTSFLERAREVFHQLDDEGEMARIELLLSELKPPPVVMGD